MEYDYKIQRKLDLADTDIAENLDLKDALQKIWATIFDFFYMRLLEIIENLVLEDKSCVTDFPPNRSSAVFKCSLG